MSLLREQARCGEEIDCGPPLYICDECVALCNDILAEEWEEEGAEDKERDEKAENWKRQIKNEREAYRAASFSAAAGPTWRPRLVPGPASDFVMIPDRGPLCSWCLDAILAVMESSKEDLSH